MEFEPIITSTIVFGSLIVSGKNIKNKISFGDRNIRLNIALLGYVCSGKTVYLTILFHELSKLGSSKYTFLLKDSSSVSNGDMAKDEKVISLYGKKLTEKIYDNINRLKSGSWLAFTDQTITYAYKAFVGETKLFSQMTYEVNINDYAGEHLYHATNEEKRNYFHDKKFFHEIVESSNAIFFCIDVELLLSGDQKRINDFFCSASCLIDIYFEKKNISIHKKTEYPLAIIFMKSDLIDYYQSTNKIIIEQSKDFIDLCEKRFMYSKLFFVSSVGKVEMGEQFLLPANPISPKNVVNPLYWVLRNVS